MCIRPSTVRTTRVHSIYLEQDAVCTVCSSALPQRLASHVTRRARSRECTVLLDPREERSSESRWTRIRERKKRVVCNARERASKRERRESVVRRPAATTAWLTDRQILITVYFPRLVMLFWDFMGLSVWWIVGLDARGGYWVVKKRAKLLCSWSNGARFRGYNG